MSGVECQRCSRKSQLWLCGPCTTDLRDLNLGLGQGQKLPNGKRGAGFIENLQDAAWGRTRMGESARRSTERSTPLPVNLGASQLLENVHGMLGTWIRHCCESRGVEVPALTTIGMALWLARNVSAIACDEAAGQCFSEVQNAVDAIERMINRPIPPRDLGPCPTLVAHHQECAIRLSAPRAAIEVTCPGCGSTHNVESLFERTLAAMAYRLLTLRELQLALAALGTPIPERTLRDWRAKGKLLPARREPDVLFLFADARRLAEDWGVRKGMTA